MKKKMWAHLPFFGSDSNTVFKIELIQLRMKMIFEITFNTPLAGSPWLKLKTNSHTVFLFFPFWVTHLLLEKQFSIPSKKKTGHNLSIYHELSVRTMCVCVYRGIIFETHHFEESKLSRSSFYKPIKCPHSKFKKTINLKTKHVNVRTKQKKTHRSVIKWNAIRYLFCLIFI